MIENKPSIYNAPSVYNQGGGGYNFDVEINGNTNTLVFPPYLVPVQYLDGSVVTGEIVPVMSTQLQAKSTYIIKCVFSLKISDMKTTNYVFDFYPAYDSGSTSHIKVFVEKSSSNIRFVVSYSNWSFWVNANSLQWDTDKITVKLDANQKKFLASDEHNNSVAGSVTSALNQDKYGLCSIMGQTLSNEYPLYGKFYYCYIQDGDNVAGLWIPCRRNDGNINFYIADCVRGSVGINYTGVFDAPGQVFGPDINLDEVQQYFE